MTVYDRFEDDNALHLRSDRKRRVLRLDALNESWRFQLTTDAHGSPRDWRRRWWRGRRWRRQFADQPAYNATDHAARNSSFDPARNSFRAPRINRHLLNNFSRGFHRRKPGIYRRYRRDRLRLRRRCRWCGWRRRRWRRRRRSRRHDERNHVRYLWQFRTDVQNRNCQYDTHDDDVRRRRNEHRNAARVRRPVAVSAKQLEHRSPPPSFKAKVDPIDGP
jgi:hypothetical protein